MLKLGIELFSQDSKSSAPAPAAVSPNGFKHFTPLIKDESRLVVHTDPNGLTAEQFRLLRRTLTQDAITGAVLLVTSPGMGDGKTVTALNLCTCLADSGDPTLLVEVDLRRPTVRAILGCAKESPGIEDALTGRLEPAQVTYWIEKLSFHAATVSKPPNDPSRLVRGIAVRQFLAWAQTHFRWVVLDAPPVVPVADVGELLPLTDGTLLVVRAASTPRELAKRAIEVLGKNIYGVIFNEVTADSSLYYICIEKYSQTARTT